MESVIENGETSDKTSKAVEVLKEISESGSSVESTVKSLITKFQEGLFNTDKGINLLDLKCHTLLNYMINVAYVALRKCHGEQIEKDDAILRLVELRTVMEKIRPIEAKLKYHIDKLLKYIPGNVDENDPLRFRANPDNLVCQATQDSESESDEEDKKKEKRGVYEPPKIAPMRYDDDVSDKKARYIEQAKKRALSSSIMQDLRAEYYDGPEEIHESLSSHRKKVDADSKRRTEYEEDYFVRLSMSAKEKHEAKKRRTQTGLNDLTHFGDIRALSGETHDEAGEFFSRKKKYKSAKGKKKFKKKGFKKRK